MRIFLIVFIFIFAVAYEPITPIKPVPYNKKEALLGKKLYFDPILSRDNKVSCATCHNAKSGTDNLPISVGVFGRMDPPMNSPTTFNAVFNLAQFWNGRAKDLIAQAKMANQAFAEMDMTPSLAEKKLNANKEYKKLFKEVYGVDYITYDLAIKAIAEFEKALITPDSKFDLYLEGKVGLSDQELRGYKKFKKFGCITCHNGVNVGGNSFQKIGVVNRVYNMPEGVDRFMVTNNLLDKYVYKVPSLRNIELTYPYMHDGSVKTLDEAIIKMGYVNLGIKLSNQDVADIKAFLKTLTGKRPEILNEN